MTMIRPPGDSTRHISPISAAGECVISSAWATMMRSMEPSRSGSWSTSTSADEERPDEGQFTTPCAAGMKAMVRIASPRKGPR